MILCVNYEQRYKTRDTDLVDQSSPGTAPHVALLLLLVHVCRKLHNKQQP